MTNLNTSPATVSTTTSAIEEALEAAKVAKVSKRVKISDEEKEAHKAEHAARVAANKEARSARKEARLANLEEQRAAKKAAREEKKAAKLAEPKKIPHLAKIEKNTVLPEISEELKNLVDAISELSAPEISAAMAHLAYKFKVKQTIASNSVTFEPGDTVKIVAGNADVLGLTGTVQEVHRIRALVNVPGFERPVYTYTADLEACEPETTECEDVTAEAV